MLNKNVINNVWFKLDCMIIIKKNEKKYLNKYETKM